MHHILKLALVCALLALATGVRAQQSQFYFLARMAPEASLSNSSQGKQVVYLRWDFVEGKLPAEIVRFRLLKNGSEIVNLPAHQVMSATQIAALYQGAAQNQRRLETVRRLNEVAADRGDAFNATNFAIYLHDILDIGSAAYHPLWSFLASRTDINIARARYHAWVDENPGGGIIEYELQAVNAQGQTARLGLVDVDTAKPVSLLSAKNLRQIIYYNERCSLPEDAKDHFTVMLNWDSPATNAQANLSDQMATRLYLSGFDIYRGTSNLLPGEQAPPRDIAVLAAQADINSNGEPLIPGLEKVNMALVLDAGNTTDPKWMETPEQLKRAGIRPGDRRAYYLVARDFTGNYGETLAVAVDIPDMRRPPTPWNLRTYANENDNLSIKAVEISNLMDPFIPLTGSDLAPEVTPGKGMLISWDAINLDNYIDAYSGTRIFCNLLDVRFGVSNVLEFVSEGQNCASDVRHSVRLDVGAYKVYRFADFDIASRFRDSDGDGYADIEERAQNMQCDRSAHPAGARNYLASDTRFFLSTSLVPGVETMLLQDSTPVPVPGKVYWYRIASVAGDRSSRLSPPMRAYFPSRTAPAEPVVDVSYLGDTPGCTLAIDSSGGNWNLTETILQEDPAAYTTKVEAISGCATVFGQPRPVIAGTFGNFQDPQSSQCQAFSSCNGEPVTLQFEPQYNCSVTISSADFCKSGRVDIVPKPGYGSKTPSPGELISGSLTVEVRPPAPGICVSLYEDFNGQLTRVADSCFPGIISYRPEATQFCGFAVSKDQNNNLSASVHIPCTLSPELRMSPVPPKLLKFTVENELAYFRYKLPVLNIASIMVKIEHKAAEGDATTEIFSLPAISSQAGDIHNGERAVAPLLLDKDTFCISMRSLARTGMNAAVYSSWSKKKCYTRTANGEDLPEYMPWPQIKALPFRQPLDGAILAPYRAMSSQVMLTLDTVADFASDLLGCTYKPASQDTAKSMDYDGLECSESAMNGIKSRLRPQLDFIMYRQTRDSGGQPGPWVQVTPRIDRVHFDLLPKILKNQDYWELNDPYINILLLNPGVEWPVTSAGVVTGEVGSTGTTGAMKFVFVDRYPLLLYSTSAMREVRYQAVYFDEEGRPSYVRSSDWLQVVE